jgi:hypothetical protein
MAVTVAMVMTSIAVIALPAVSAETVNTSSEYFEDFNEMTLTANTTGQATMQALYSAGWLSVDNTKYYTLNQVGKYADAGTQFVSVVQDPNNSENRYLQINRPTIPGVSDNSVYGLGRAFPGQGTNTKTTGIWEINFDFKPTASPGQFNFGFNTMDGSAANPTDAQHNIISAYRAKMYLGHRNYMTLYSCNSSVDTIAAANAWFKMRVIVDCDNHYYTVEIYNSAGQLGARRSAISFAGNESVGFFKMSALGLAGSASTVYVDNVRIRRQSARETLIYNETFDKFGSVRLASSAMSTGGETENYSGVSYFVGNTPWRAHSEVGNSHAFETDSTLNSQVVRLGDLPDTTDTTEASGLVYMPVLEKLVDSTTQDVRGKVKLSFKIKPSVIGSTFFSVNAIADHTQDINSDSARICVIGKTSDGTPVLYKDNTNKITLDKEKWFNIDLIFDVLNHTVTTKLTNTKNQSTSFSKTYSYLTALKGIMFKVNGGASVLMDDIKLEYYEYPPVIGTVSLTDMFGNTVTDNTNVSPALEKIVIPVGCTLDNNTASAATIKLKDSDGTEVVYKPSRANKEYTLILNSETLEIKTTLKENETYTVTVPSTLANFLGGELGTDFTYTFTTGALPKVLDIGSVKVDGNASAGLSDIKEGSAINVAVNYANSTNSDVTGNVIVVFYGNGKVVKVLTNYATFAAGEYGTDSTTFNFTVPSNLDMNGVDAVSVLLWDNFTDITPQCPAVNFPNN